MIPTWIKDFYKAFINYKGNSYCPIGDILISIGINNKRACLYCVDYFQDLCNKFKGSDDILQKKQYILRHIIKLYPSLILEETNNENIL